MSRGGAARCPRGLAAERHVEHVRLRGGGRCRGHTGRVPIALLSVRFPRRRCSAWSDPTRGPRRARPGHRVEPHLRDRALPAGPLLPDEPLLVVAYAIMFFPLAVVSVRAAVARAPVGLEEVGGSLGVSRRSVLWRVTLPAGGPGPGRRLRAGLPGDGNRAHGDARAPPDERGDAGHAVLGLRVERVLPPGRPVRGGHGAHRGRAGLRARPLVRPPARPDGRGRPERPDPGAVVRRPEWRRREGPSHQRRRQGVRAASRCCAGWIWPCRHGSFTAILGSSGSGKTTLLRIVAGFERPDDGEVAIGGRGGRRRRPPLRAERTPAHRLRPPGGRAVPAPERGRNVAFGLPGARTAATGSTSSSRWWGCPATVGATRTSSRAGSSSGSPWPGRWPSSPRSSSSTSPSPRSTPPCAPRSVPTCSPCCARPGTTSILVTHDQDEALSMADQVAVLRHGVIAQLDTRRPSTAGPATWTWRSSWGSRTSSRARSHERHGAHGRLAAASRSAAGNGSAGRAGGPRSWSGPSRSGWGGPERRRSWRRCRATSTTATMPWCGCGPSRSGLPDLVVRVTGGVPLEPGRRVGLSRARGGGGLARGADGAGTGRSARITPS